jgi:hypothetical protein
MKEKFKGEGGRAVQLPLRLLLLRKVQQMCEIY